MTYLVGGISSAGRALPKINDIAFSVSKSNGAYLWDQNGKRYIDTAMGFGATMLGHGDADVLKSVIAAQCNGPMPSFAHDLEEEAAAALAKLTSPLEKVIFVNSGSEAVHLASRTARVATGKKRIAKIAAGYDGWYDDVAFGNVDSQDALMNGKRPEKDGMVLVKYNDIEDLTKLFEEYDDIAAVIVEPLLANAGCLKATPEFLKALPKIVHENGALVILDEVLMGFRISAGLTGHYLGLDADLATVGKAIGSGFPVAALVGRPEIMTLFEQGKIARAGTYNGNPPVCAAVIETLRKLASMDYLKLLSLGDELRQKIVDGFKRHGQSVSTTGFGSVFTIWPTETPPVNYAESLTARSQDWTQKLHVHLRKEGVTLMPFSHGRLYITFAHNEETLAELANCFENVAKKMKP